MFFSIVVAGTGISQVAKKIPLAAKMINAPIIINEVILFIGEKLSVLLLAARKKSFERTV